MPRVISILSTIVAFGAVLAYAMWPSTRPKLSEARECAERASYTERGLREQVEELEAARRRLELEVQALRQLVNRGQDAPPPERPYAPEPMEAQKPRSVPQLSAALTREQRMLSLRQRNGQLFREAGLSAEQIQALLPVLALQEERLSTFAVLQRDHDELAQAVGQEKATQFENLRKAQRPAAPPR